VITKTEIEPCETLGEWWNLFVGLPNKHPADAVEATFHIHALQHMVMGRAAVRDRPDIFRGGE